MELVEGEDLKERIDRGSVPLDEAMPIGLQISQALEAAHEIGIIHRDLKPANIKVTPGGQVKVLDFGLAKALDPDTVELGIIADYFRGADDPPGRRKAVVKATCGLFRTPKIRLTPTDLLVE